MPPEPIWPLWAQLSVAAGGFALMPPVQRFAGRTLRVVRERHSAAREYRLGGVSRLRALWLAVTL